MIYPNLEDRKQCLVNIFYKYYCHLPLKRKCSALYLRPKKVFNKGDVWFQDSPIRINKLQNTIKNIIKEAALLGNYTNHSLRSTATTRLYQGGVEEQVICELTGHRSLAVRSYKHTHNLQKECASQILHDNPIKKWWLHNEWQFWNHKDMITDELEVIVLH